LFNGPFEDELGVLGPSLSQIYGLISSGEEDTVDFGEDGGNLLRGAEGVNGDDLGAGHFNKLDVRGGDVGFEVIDVVFVACLGEDTDDGSLLGVGLGEGEGQNQ
jgi:hypothetical protein